MKKIAILLYMALAVFMAYAQDIAIVPGDVKVKKADRNLAVGMTLDLASLPVKSNMSVTVTPVLTSDAGDRLELPSVTVAGRGRYYTLKREHSSLVKGNDFYRYSKDMTPLNYTALVPYSPWMRGSVLSLETNVEGCCSNLLGKGATAIETLKLDKATYTADYVFATPKAEAVKTRRVEGSAFIDFKVNQTVILPDFGHNPGELAKIRQSIDEVRNNEDTKITSLSITGYASPEGSYANNERLAKGRTEALAAYVNSLYNFQDGLIKTASIAEDWEGVRKFLKDNPSFQDCEKILAIVNSDIDPDVKNERIKREYPVAYRYMLENVYPPLRHSDYMVDYIVRQYTTVEEIAEVFRTKPGNLSLQELFVLGQSLPEGSQEYADVFETAARLNPDSKEAALNAGLAAMKRGDYVGSSRHLANAGNSPEAIYARGLLAAYTEDFAGARTLLEQARDLGIAQANEALRNLTILEQDQ